VIQIHFSFSPGTRALISSIPLMTAGSEARAAEREIFWVCRNLVDDGIHERRNGNSPHVGYCRFGAARHRHYLA
ncbi:hypothetical protein ACQX8W_14925, partial [Staphylococcus aureus]|uniref:hypothetical protein n=2 Tax=Bacilli TaxID=91061 RepID=UPI003D2525A7